LNLNIKRVKFQEIVLGEEVNKIIKIARVKTVWFLLILKDQILRKKLVKLALKIK